jgi:hypothetical protein
MKDAVCAHAVLQAQSHMLLNDLATPMSECMGMCFCILKCVFLCVCVFVYVCACCVCVCVCVHVGAPLSHLPSP